MARYFIMYEVSVSIDDFNISPVLTYHQECFSLMLRILRMISPRHLRVLYIEYPYGSPFPEAVPLLPVTFPNLVELSISGPLTPVSFEQSKLIPRLERLHIRKYTILPFSFGDELARICPSLTHLRIMALQIYNSRAVLPGFVRDFVEGESSSWQSRSVPFPSTLHRVIIEFLPLQCSNDRDAISARSTHLAHVEIYQRIASYGRQSGITGTEDKEGSQGSFRPSLLVLPPAVAMSHVEIVGKIWMADFSRTKWLERSTNSGGGCWV